MPLTKNLYREDEVAAALMFCCVRGKMVEAIFWCQEMLDSGLIDPLLTALRDVWLYGFGVKALGWFRELQSLGDAIDPDDILQLVAQLSTAEKDRSILLILASAAGPDRVSIGRAPPGLDKFQSFVALAILQRKTLTAWEGVKSMADPDPFLRTVAMAKHGVAGCQFLLTLEGLGRWEGLAAAVAALCLSAAEFAASWKAPSAATVEQALGGRAYEIPFESLGWKTARGQSRISTEKEIMGRLEKPGALWGSVYWDEIAEGLGGWGEVRSNWPVREAFYDQHFPDDIPDEWSSKERSKSHGIGADMTPAATFRAWFNRARSAVVWTTTEQKIGDSWDTLWDGITVPDVSTWDLRLVTARNLVPSDS